MSFNSRSSRSCYTDSIAAHYKGFFNSVSIGKYCTEISRLNDFMYYAESTSPFKGLHRLPVVYPSAEMKLDKEGNSVMERFNGLLTLTVGKLHDKQEAEAIKQAAAILPSTTAAMLGISGRSVKIIVAISRPGGILPLSLCP